MHISLKWLRELVEFSLSPEDLAQVLTMAGFEVEDIEDRRQWAEGVVLGKVFDCQPHPNADKLRVCLVDVGGETPLNIVCGAPNARANIFVPVATVGAYLPKVDLKIKKSKLRGVPSEGMLCSLAELGLAKESEGIEIFETLEGYEIGSDARPLLGLDDAILDLTSTANRADALSMVGIAREVAALTGGTLKLPAPKGIDRPKGNSALTVTVEAPKACPTYIATEITGVTIAPSPRWLQQRLTAAGIRPINNVVDVTNYVLLEWGQPLHAFDRDRLGSTDMGVRFARAGESLKTLDGQQRELQSQNLLITAGDRPVALAGIMGGENSEVQDDTQNLILEAALFDSVAVRRSARAQGIRTEASTRYERGVNQAELEIACQRAVELILQLARGSVTGQKKSDRRPDKFTQEILLNLDRVRQVLGNLEQDGKVMLVPEADIERSLKALGMEISPTSVPRVWLVTVPAYRARDIGLDIDLIEEIARIIGYDRFCDTFPGESAGGGSLSPQYQLMRRLRATLRGVGLTELLHYSLVKPEEGDRQVKLANPLFAEYSALRTEMLSALLEAFQYNLEQGNGALNGFEIGRVFVREGDTYVETDTLAGIMGGDITQGRWVRGDRPQPLTWFEAKGRLETAFRQMDLAVDYHPDRSHPLLHPGRTATLHLGDKPLGIFGQLHPQVCQERGLPDEVYLFQIDMGTLFDALTADGTIPVKYFAAYSTFPAIARDIAFFLPVEVSVAEITRAIQQAGAEMLTSVELFDEYRGEHVPEGQRSLAFRLHYRAGDRTLTDVEVDPVQERVRQTLVDTFQVALRS